MGKSEHEILGSDDSAFFPVNKFEEIETSDKKVILERSTVELPLQQISINGKFTYLKTNKIPFNSPDRKEDCFVGITLIFSEDNLLQPKIRQANFPRIDNIT